MKINIQYELSDDFQKIVVGGSDIDINEIQQACESLKTICYSELQTIKGVRKGNIDLIAGFVEIDRINGIPCYEIRKDIKK